ncbi:hypothetical protein AVEN_145205-1 [Araneus ventricosus]|uniref:Uncharacterized protein n=1 Tax=Araneus ventricosus TaxID=182803 RepID=A0A4Y2W638_ARAVE|nr:hypothetical protein AVEN_145205-1 [Araneus ventricosus]
MIGSSVDYVRSGGMRNVPVTKAVEHLYATIAKFSGCVLLASRPAYSYPPRRGKVDRENSLSVKQERWFWNQESVKLSKSEQTILRARCQPLVTKSWIKTKTDLAEAWQCRSDIQEENRIGEKEEDEEGIKKASKWIRRLLKSVDYRKTEVDPGNESSVNPK